MLQLVSLLTFFLADIVKLGEKLEIGKCLPRGSKDIYADIARFKGLIKGRKSWDDDPCNFSIQFLRFEASFLYPSTRGRFPK